MLFPEEVRLMRERYADYLRNIEHKPKWRRKLMDVHWRLRSKVYGLLEKPKTPLSVFYHIAIFVYILIVHTASSMISHSNEANDRAILKRLAQLEKMLAFYFFIEFLLRIWSAGADGRFQGWQGRKRFVLQIMCIFDTVILIFAIIGLLLAEYRYSGWFLDILRFVQILRFLHIDRQMISWTLLKNYIKRSKHELISIYYIVSMIFALMAFLVFTLESNESKGGLIPNSGNATFTNYGEAFWFSAISIFTIGYGDIIPSNYTTKIVVCIFSYVGLCMFGAASTLAGVGLSLMLDHRNKAQKQSKVRNLAATTIQIWYRYHLVTNDKTFNSIPIFAKFCGNLNRFEEKLKQQRMNTKRFGAYKQKARKKKFLINPIATNHLTISSEYELKRALRNYKDHLIPSIFVSSTEINEDQEQESTHSLPKGETQSELQILARKIAIENQKRRGSGTVNPMKPEKKRMSLVRFLQSRKVTNSVSGGYTNNIDCSFESTENIMDNREMDYYYGSADERSIGSCMTLSENVSLAGSGLPILTGKQQGILRIMHYIRFMVLRKRFKRARMPYELDDAEDELCELEHRRMHAFKQLEKQYSNLLGKQRPVREDSDENANLLANQSKKTLLSRIDECENQLAGIESKALKLEVTLVKLMDLIQQKVGDEHLSYYDSSPDTFVLQVPQRSSNLT